MQDKAGAAKPLISLKEYAERMGVSRQAVYYQVSIGRCLVPPIEGTKPLKWYRADVETFLAGSQL